MQVAWVPLQKKAAFGVLSACSGGKVLLWLLGAGQRALVPSAAYTLAPQQVPHGPSLKVIVSGAGGPSSRPLNCGV